MFVFVGDPNRKGDEDGLAAAQRLDEARAWIEWASAYSLGLDEGWAGAGARCFGRETGALS